MTPTCSFCGKTASLEEAEYTMHLIYGAGGVHSYSCRDVHECRWRMQAELDRVRQHLVEAHSAPAALRPERDALRAFIADRWGQSALDLFDIQQEANDA